MIIVTNQLLILLKKCVVFAIVLQICLPTSAIYAQSSDEFNSIYAGYPYYDSNSSGTNCSTGSSAPTDGSSSAANNQAIAYNYLMRKGYTSEQAAGVVGNMIIESVGPIPKRLQGVFNKEVSSADVSKSTEDGWGLVQWTPAGKIIKNSLDAGKDYTTIDDINFQLDFLWGQLSGTDLGGKVANESPAGKKIAATTTVEEAAITFAAAYERFKGNEDRSNPKTIANYAKRVDEAKKVYSKFSGGTPDVSTASTPCNGNDAIPSTGKASDYITDCGVNNGNAQIACSAINQLLGIEYSQPKRAAPTDNAPKFLDCSSLVAMAIYRTFGTDLGGICSVEFLSNKNFNIIDVHDIQPGDIVGHGSSCGDSGHLAIVVSYNKATKKLITVDAASEKYLSGIRGIGGPGGFNVGLTADGNGSLTWAVRYIGPKTTPSVGG